MSHIKVPVNRIYKMSHYENRKAAPLMEETLCFDTD